MHRDVVRAVVSRVNGVWDAALVIEIRTISDLKSVRARFIAQPDGEHVLVRVRDGGGEGRVRDGALVILITRPQHPTLGERPVATDADSEGVPPVLRGAVGAS